MAVKIYMGVQDKEKTKASQLMDMGASDFNVDENISELVSERFQDVQAQGDSTISKIDVTGSINMEFSKETIEYLMPAISYEKNKTIYKMGKNTPKFYTIILVDAERNEKWEYIDCIINSIKLNIPLGGYITGSVDIIGKTYDIGTGGVTNSKPAGDILRSLYSNIKLDNTDVSVDIEGVEITINNGVEAKGSLNSLYNTKFRRATPMTTQVNINKNEYEPSNFKSMKTKMIEGTPTNALIKLGTPNQEDTVLIEIPKMFIKSNKRGDYKGAGSHNVELNASVNNADNTHIKFTFKE